MDPRAEVTQAFEAHYGEAPAFVVRAPGRVNLIGEHTDYNDGFVFPMAINRAIYITLRPRDDRQVVVRTLDFEDHTAFSLDDIQKGEASPAEYIKGTAWALGEAGYTLTGWEGVLKGDVPIGAGLSSSAALEMATACAFAAVSGFTWDAPTIAKLGQKAENQWVGVSSGIMDQMISASGRADHALLIDCRTLETEAAPLPPGTVVVVLDTDTRRGLVGSAYNERRAQCESAAQFFGISALRDVDMTTFEAQADELDELIRRRARHVISENQRTLEAKAAMQRGDAGTLGQLMNASHASLRDDFEVSSEALNAIVDCAQKQAGCHGARMTGAGFGGCAVALVDAEAEADFVQAVTTCYHQATGRTPRIYVSTATNGAEILTE